MQAGVKRWGGKFQNFSPFNHRFGLPSEFQHSVVSFIAAVGPSGGPYAILRRIALVVIFAFNLMAGRTPAHVLEKIRKRVPPTSAHLNTSTAVPLELAARSLRTPSNYRSPDRILAACLSAICFCPGFSVNSLLFTNNERRALSAATRSVGSDFAAFSNRRFPANVAFEWRK